MMLIKKVKQADMIPLFYAPYMLVPARNWEKHCTFIGLNVIFYLAVEFYYSVKGLVRVCGNFTTGGE